MTKNDNSLEIYIFPEPGSYGIDGISLITNDINLNLLYSAYLQGVFPWFDELSGDPVCWYSPEKRFVITQDTMHVPSSVKKFLKHSPYTYTMDKCFNEVMKQCGLMKREGQQGTWIGPKMLKAYSEFHQKGFAHSFEVWKDDNLVGGFYGILLGSVFCGESMFTVEPNSSKSAFCLFADCFFSNGGKLIDCQVYTDNMARYGGFEITRQEFLMLERELIKKPLEKNLKAFYEK